MQKRESYLINLWFGHNNLWLEFETLLSKFSEYMPDELFERFYDNEDGSWIKDYKDEIQDIFDSNWLNNSYDDIPYWGELIKQYEGNWKYQPRRK